NSLLGAPVSLTLRQVDTHLKAVAARDPDSDEFHYIRDEDLFGPGGDARHASTTSVETVDPDSAGKRTPKKSTRRKKHQPMKFNLEKQKPPRISSAGRRLMEYNERQAAAAGHDPSSSKQGGERHSRSS
ncbi:unnamed protein product, partial [Amoebophrya sp. A25]